MIYKLTILLLLMTSASSLAALSDQVATPPVPNFSPGPEYADDARMFQGIPGIERAENGRLWATWYGGGTGEDFHNYVMLVTSGDDGHGRNTKAAGLEPDGVNYRGAICTAIVPKSSVLAGTLDGVVIHEVPTHPQSQ